MRLEAAADDVRGSGVLFARPGRSSSAESFVPDYEVTFDVEGRRLDVALDGDEIARRVERYEAPRPAYETGVLAKYAKLVSSASAGAVTG